jgi:ABC-2 type transport system ATP-binding protein
LKAVEEVIERLGLGEYADRRAGTLSLGNNQRLGLAKALLHRPALLMLDEPANGLDPAGIVEIRNLLLELAQEQGITVFVSSHILGEVSRLATRLGIIHHGRLIQELGVDELRGIPRGHLKVRTRDLRAALPILHEAGYPAEITQDEAIEIVSTAALDHPDMIAALLVHAGCALTMLNVEQEDLEHYFLKLVGAEREVVE